MVVPAVAEDGVVPGPCENHIVFVGAVKGLTLLVPHDGAHDDLPWLDGRE